MCTGLPRPEKKKIKEALCAFHFYYIKNKLIFRVIVFCYQLCHIYAIVVAILMLLQSSLRMRARTGEGEGLHGTSIRLALVRIMDHYGDTGVLRALTSTAVKLGCATLRLLAVKGL